MPLRNPNAITDATLGAAFINILTGYPSANTQAGIQGYPVKYHQAFDAYKGNYPFVLVNVGPQHYTRSSRATWNGDICLYVDYYDRYDQQPSELDTIRATIALDLERMKANIEDNESLAQNNTAYAVSAYKHELSPYEGYFRELNAWKLIYRRYTCCLWLLPYDG